MPRGWYLVTLGLALLSQIYSQPVDDSKRTDSISTKSERTWLWGWAWGAESTVSIVDRSPVVSFPSRPAAFGADIRNPILGYIIPLSSFTVPCSSKNASLSPSPNTGCPDLCISGPHKPNEAWIALVQRGKCEFVKKVRQAQHLGAKAVVVGGEDPEVSGYPDALVNMYSPEDSSDVNIAATYIRYSDYARLFSMIESSNTTHSGLPTLSLMITAEYAAWEWYSPIITFVVILLLPSALTFITLLIHRIRAARAAQRDRAPETVVRNLPWHVWTGTHWEKHEGGEAIPRPPPPDPDLEIASMLNNNEPPDPSDDGDASSSHPKQDSVLRPWFEAQLECAICLSEFVKGDKVRVLPCHHIFHLDEVDEWLIQRKKLCPVCKADVTQPWHPPPRLEPHTVSNESPTEHATERTPLLTHSESTV